MSIHEKGVNVNNFEKCEYWLELADDDLLTAKALLKTKRLLFCGFVCHLIIEKAFKAVIAKRTKEMPPKTHDLPKLAQKGGLYDELSPEHLALLDKLKNLQIEARYPSYKDAIYHSLTFKYCDKLVKETEELLCWIKQESEK